MKKHYLRLLPIGLLCALAIIASACSSPQQISDVPSTPVADISSPSETQGSSPTIEPTDIPEIAVESTSPSFPTVVLPPTITAEPSPQDVDPFIVTRHMSDVRVGPGVNYSLSHTLGQGARASVQGRSVDGQWWAIPGPGDGPGPLGWIQAVDADFIGDANSIPVLSAPSDGRTDVPIHSDPGSPPTNVCTVTPLGNGLSPVYIRLGPGEQFNVTYRLGGWAEVLRTEIGWHMILLGPGETGWVNASQVEASGPCP